jgi:hypothetical protein
MDALLGLLLQLHELAEQLVLAPYDSFALLDVK